MGSLNLDDLIESANDIIGLDQLKGLCLDERFEHLTWFDHHKGRNPDEADSFLQHVRLFDARLERIEERKTDIRWRLSQ